MKAFVLYFALFLLVCGFQHGHAMTRRYKFVVQDTPATRVCESKSILTVNGQFPGPTLHVTEGDTLIVDVINNATENITIHWHGVKQVRYPWSDGPVYITQCPIRPGTRFSQRIVLSDEIGTLWWHAHSDWSRATVNGALVVHPRKRNDLPFPAPAAEFPIILGEWWNITTRQVLDEMEASGGDARNATAFLINGQPGDRYLCSRPDTYKFNVDPGKTYLLRMVNAVMNSIMFFKVANHNLTVVASDGSYLKPFTTEVVAIAPGETMDFLLEANQQPSHYYMAARPYKVAGTAAETITTAILQYTGNYSAPSSPVLPVLPPLDDTPTAVAFLGKLRSLPTRGRPVDVPRNVNKRLFFTLSVNVNPCPPEAPCNGSLAGRLRASINNITFVSPKLSILQAYYNNISGVYGSDFPNTPRFTFNYTQEIRDFLVAQSGTEVNVLEYNSEVELVYQGTGLLGGAYHPMHLHGYNFYVMGMGLGNFNPDTDPKNYNLVDPPYQNTVVVPQTGWVAIRFKANNPGVWFMHCHLERHAIWGMEMAFIVKNGKGRNETLLPPPPDMPRC